jgi:AbrB family looped-hinge helix DNA binding protein
VPKHGRGTFPLIPFRALNANAVLRKSLGKLFRQKSMKVILGDGMEEPEIAIVGTKGQIVIPQGMREELEIKPRTKLAVYKRGDKLVLTKLKIPSLGEELRALFREIDENYRNKKRPTEKEILEEIQAYRREKRANPGA